MGLKINTAAIIELYECGEEVVFCAHCGQITQCADTDADGSKCEACGMFAVKGIETLRLEIA